MTTEIPSNISDTVDGIYISAEESSETLTTNRHLTLQHPETQITFRFHIIDIDPDVYTYWHVLPSLDSPSEELNEAVWLMLSNTISREFPPENIPFFWRERRVSGEGYHDPILLDGAADGAVERICERVRRMIRAELEQERSSWRNELRIDVGIERRVGDDDGSLALIDEDVYNFEAIMASLWVLNYTRPRFDLKEV